VSRNEQLPVSYLTDCFSYDPESGALRWRSRPLQHFKTATSHKIFLTRNAGKEAGCIDHSTGYLVIGVRGRIYYAHRIVWALLHGEWPSEQIDHIDGNKLNNAETNLRCVSHAENAKNMPIKKSNKSGVQGVSFAKREGKWRARITCDYRDIHCGYFDTMEEAIVAREHAVESFGYHPNHGRTA
jgi:hypothetical protein